MVKDLEVTVPEDQVTIDPDYRSTPSDTGKSGWLRLAVVMAMAFVLGWLLRSPTSDGIEATGASSSATSATRETTSTTLQSITTPPRPVTIGLTMPLDEVVPGFADTITLAVWSGLWEDDGVDILRWRPSQAAPNTVLSLRSPDAAGWFAGLDAEGKWFAVHDQHGLLSVQRAAATAAGADWWAPTREAIGLGTVDSAWHDTKAGYVAWVACPRTSTDAGTVYTLAITDRLAEPVAVASVPDTCNSPVVTWIARWGDWGFAIEQGRVWTEEADDGGSHAWTVLLDPTGTEFARLDHDTGGVDVVAAGPTGVIVTEEISGGSASSMSLSLDGLRTTPVPGLNEGEWADRGWWSPDGSLIAVALSSLQADHASIRIVNTATGEKLGEISQPGWVGEHACWSSDGRFLLYVADRRRDDASDVALVVYDTADARIAAEVPLAGWHDSWEIRTAAPAPAGLLTPVEWDIALEDERRGIHTVYMIADAGPLLPDQIDHLSGQLIWDETIVSLCNVSIRDVGDGYLHVGDIFQTTEGCGSNPTAMQNAFDAFGPPVGACLEVRSDVLDQEYCAPLLKHSGE